jgi:citrate synthase
MHRTKVVIGHVANSLAVQPTAGEETLSVTNKKTGKTAEIKIKDNTIKASDLKQVGLKTYDPGYTNTTCCYSTVSWIDGDKGILRYRGIPIEQLAVKSSHLEVCFLVIYGELPTSSQLATFSQAVMQESLLDKELMKRASALEKCFRQTAHPMHQVCAGFAILGSFYNDQNPAAAGQDIYKDKAVRNKQVIRLLGAGATITAMAFCHSTGKKFTPPNPALGYAENFLTMIGMTEGGKVNPKLSKALDVLFILHAEHELNCSTSAMRHITSSNACVYTAVAAATAALFGPKHGGANEAVLHMLKEIGDVKNVEGFVKKVKNREAQLMGFGHRVYKNYDPRAKIVRKLCDDVFSVLGRDPLIEVAMALEKIALEDEYFVSRKLYPNVDFYSGLIYKAMGFPTDFFTCLFTLPRLAGWLAHWSEWVDDPDNKIYRPFQIYTGYDVRDYQDASGRKEGVAPLGI